MEAVQIRNTVQLHSLASYSLCNHCRCTVLLIKMYNVKGPSKIVAKTRRGLVQNIEVKNKKSNSNGHIVNNNNDNVLNNNNEEIMVKGPKPVFQNVNKKLHQNGYHHHHDYDEQQVVTPQHEEIVNYVSNSWNCVCSELDLHANSSDGSSSPRSDNSVYYYEDDQVNLSDFKPFDLESWWGKRLYTYITNSVNTTTS